ncbi:MAG: cyoA [Candidatus Saccharibacteria bacterium]|jgi:cytochrome o ubiquinol oxidase subunit 2|nr:cyoA [Candidatus Saccharibacteria bacterium]
MPRRSKKPRQGNLFRVLFLAVLAFVLLITVLLNGSEVRLLNPKGLIAQQELYLGLVVTAVLAVLIVPSLIFAYFVAWKYRESSPKKAAYEPNARYGKRLDVAIWGIPTVFMLILSLLLVPATHKLEPKKAIVSSQKPLNIKVVSLRWKWVFIYPEQKIATVNFVQIPVDRPVQFDLTADESPMSSFWIPNLSGMLYAMTGMTNQLNLVANEEGDYPGSSGEITGSGFADMRFTARASSQEEFDEWVRVVKMAPETLDTHEYQELLVPSEADPQVVYSAVEDNLYDKVLMKYMAAGGGHGHGGHGAAQPTPKPHSDAHAETEPHTHAEGHTH